MTDQEIIEFLSAYGHLRYPFGKEQDLPEDIATLRITDAPVVEAIKSHQAFDTNYQWLSGVYYREPMDVNGLVGPVTRAVIEAPRCGAVDYSALSPDEDEAVGSGSWKSCHNIGSFHAAGIRVTNSPPSFLAPFWDLVKRRVTSMYDDVGLRWLWDMEEGYQTSLTFVGSSGGWIGLAIVGQGETCTSEPIWLRLLSTYRGGSTDEKIITMWTTLTAHELGHNTGLAHSRGGVMNPSIVDGLPPSWVGDPSESLLRKRFGGVAVPGGSPPPDPPPGPDPPVSELVKFSLGGKKYLIIPDPGYSDI